MYDVPNRAHYAAKLRELFTVVAGDTRGVRMVLSSGENEQIAKKKEMVIRVESLERNCLDGLVEWIH